MALTATLALDVKAFEGGLSRATASLEGFAQKTVRNTNRDLSRMLEEFTGQRVVAESARMVEAVERIGGASRLTEAEQRRVNATVTEAIAKYEALGQQAPDNLVKLQAATTRADGSTNTFLSTVGRLTAAFSLSNIIERGAAAVLSFASAAVKGAGDLVDLHKATGASIESLQRWGHVADQGGIELTTMTNAAFKLGAAIDGGTGSVRQGVDALGLSFTTLRDLSPEDQMEAILVAADALGPTQERNAALVDLFGTRGAAALARIVDGYRETAAEAAIAGDKQVEAIDRASDAWSKFLRGLTTGFTQTMGNVVLAMQNLGSGIDDLTDKERQQIAFLKKSGGDVEAYIQQLVAARAEQAASAAASAAATGTSAAAQASFAEQLVRVNAELAALTPAQRAEIDAAMALGVSVDALTLKFGLSEEALRLYRTSKTETVAAERQHVQVLSEVATAIGAMQGPSETMLNLESRTLQETGKLTAALKAWAIQNGAVVPTIRQVNAALGEQAPLMAKANTDWVGFAGSVQQNTTAAATSSGGFMDKLKGLFGGGEGGSSLSGMLNTVGPQFAAAFLGPGSASDKMKAFATQGMSALLSMVPGVGPWLSAFSGPIVEGLSKLAAKGKAILSSMFGGPSASELEGRASVKEFEEGLWATLDATQQLEAGGENWKKTVIAIRDAYIKAGKTEEEALEAAERLWKSSTISAEESKRVIEEIQGVINGLPTNKTVTIGVDNQTGTSPSGSGGGSSAPSGSGASSGGSSAPPPSSSNQVVAPGSMGSPVELKITVPIALDGRTIAEVVVPYIPDELYRRGV